MDSETEKCLKKQNQLQEHIEQLFIEKKMLQDKISVLSECLSLKKVKQKISVLENKQKILTCLEGMVCNLRTDIKPLEYLKQLLQKELTVSNVSRLSTDDFEVEEQKEVENSESLLLTQNSECAIETLDSLSDDGSEDSVMVLSEYDFVSNDDVCNDMEKTAASKVMYEEALLMASSVHSTLTESHILSSGSSSNIIDQTKDLNCTQFNSKDTDTLMNASSKSEQLLKTFDIVNDHEILNCNDIMKSKCNIETIESTTLEVHQSSKINEEFDNDEIKLLDCAESNTLSESVIDSWVKLDTNKSSTTPIKSEQTIKIFQEITRPQKVNITPKLNSEEKTDELNDQLCNSHCLSENKSFENVCDYVIHDYKNEMFSPICSTSGSNKANSLFLNIDGHNVSNDIEVKTRLQNNQLYNEQIESNNMIEIKCFESICKDVNHNCKNEFNNLVSSINSSTAQSMNEIEINSSLLKIDHTKLSKECNDSELNKEEEFHLQNELLCNHQRESKFESVHNGVDYNYHKNENPNPVSSTDFSMDEIKMKSELLNAAGSLLHVSREGDNLLTNDNNVKLSSLNKNDKQSCHIDDLHLNVELLNGIHQHGIQDLMTLQLQCISHCVKGRDIIFYSYPCVGKSIMCFISVLQKIDTSINECQAIVLVPTLVLALSAQKTIKSLGKFLNVSTCIGGNNVPRKVSPVPHIVISTPNGLCDMINCNSLCKDFIKMLVIDDMDEMIKCRGFFNLIGQILLFLNNDRQLIILSSSRLEEILDQFSHTMQDPEYIIVPDLKPSLNDIAHYYVDITEKWKFEAFGELFEVLNLMRTVVYCDTWDKCLKTADNMHLKPYAVSAVHNGMDNSQRYLILQQFRSGITRVLITNKLQKGENFSDVLWIINYDLPKTSKDYVRRIVGCFDRRVKVINFITTNDINSKTKIENELNFHMLYLPQDVTAIISVSNFPNDPICRLMES